MLQDGVSLLIALRTNFDKSGWLSGHGTSCAFNKLEATAWGPRMFFPLSERGK